MNVKSRRVSRETVFDFFTIGVKNIPQIKYIKKAITMGLISGKSETLSSIGFERTWINAAVIAAIKMK